VRAAAKGTDGGSLKEKKEKLKGMSKWLHSKELRKTDRRSYPERPSVAGLNCKSHEGTAKALLRAVKLEQTSQQTNPARRLTEQGLR